MRWEVIGLTRPEPVQVVRFLTRDEDVHAPHAGDDVHGEDNRSEHGQLPEHVGRLLLALIHVNVDLREVIRVGSRQQPVKTKIKSASIRFRFTSFTLARRNSVLTSRSDRDCSSLSECGLGYRQGKDQSPTGVPRPTARCTVSQNL